MFFWVGREEKSLEKFKISPCNTYIVFAGVDGFIIILCRKTKQWIGNLKMNTTCRDFTFSQDGEYLFSFAGKNTQK